MKILHTADIHLGDLNGPIKDGENARRQDTLACMASITNTAQRQAINGEPVNVAIIAGDLFNRSRVWADTALEDINDAINELLRPLCRTCEHVVLLFGTENHDNPKAFEVIAQTTQDEKNLHIYTTPGVHTLTTGDGPIQILALPGYDKGRLRAFMPDADKDTENRTATAIINDILMGLSAQIGTTTPSVLVGHYTIAGSEADNGTTFLAGQDVVVLPQTIDAAGVTLACFGHIHKAQQINSLTPAFYSGSPNQLTFNDEQDEHGFYIHEMGGDITGVLSTFYGTPERKHKTVRLGPDEIGFFNAEGKLPGPIPSATGAIVRIRYIATAEQDKALNKAAFQKHLLDGGAFHVAEILREDAEDDAPAVHVENDETPTATLHRYLSGMKERGLEISDEDINRLEELATPIIKKADDGREADQHAGAFIPKRIEVKNYRSYTGAAFDFSEIRMAMVNGQNGVGKSSMFMDAIADCLYEESRDGQIGGWLRDGEKSGSVSFEFEMGGAEYKVTRTRTKSGKGTLAFNRLNDTGEWVSESDSTMKLTQAKITQALGMDYQTFCSIALIRQDAYGIFLETDSDRRMEVLSSLLNLGVYSRAEEQAKAEATEQRRKIASIKDRMSVLNDQMAEKEAIETQLQESEAETVTNTQQIAALETQINAAQREETLRQEVIRQADEKAAEAQRYNAQAREKEAALQGLKAQQTEAQALADQVEATAQAVKAVEAARAALEPYADSVKELLDAKERRDVLTRNKATAQAEITRIQTDRAGHEKTLGRKAEIEAAAQEIERIRAARADLSARAEEYNQAAKAVQDIKQRQDAHVTESRIRINSQIVIINAAHKKAALLEDSKCPIADEATCEFLKDAQEAVKSLVTLQDALQKAKEADRQQYEAMGAELKAAQEALAALTNPQAEADALTTQEREAAPIAALAGKLEAAAATIIQLEKQETAQVEAVKTTGDEITALDGKLPELEQRATQAAKYREEIRSNGPKAALHAKCAAAAATVKALDTNIDTTRKDAVNAG